MNEFLNTALSLPTLAFTVMLGITLLYWLSVMVGMLDLEVFDPGGALDGVDGTLDGIDGVGGGADAELDVDGDGGAGGGLAGALHALRLRYAPLTVIFSFIALFGWTTSFFGARYLYPLLPLGGLLSGVIVALAALLVAWPLTALVTRPLAPLFKTEPALANRDLIGSVVTVKTGRVDKGFGQATLQNGQGELLLKVRCDAEFELTRGDHALIVAWDEASKAFDLEPMDALMNEVPGTKKQRRS